MILIAQLFSELLLFPGYLNNRLRPSLPMAIKGSPARLNCFNKTILFYFCPSS